jgi:uncharacterized repeat protein (TIGR03803 family)
MMAVSSSGRAQTLTYLYSFCSQYDAATSRCLDGDNPYAGLLQATDGNFYGTSYWGGANAGGTVFKITPGGTLTTLYSFCSLYDPQTDACTDGFYPDAGLLQATDGNFYGTTAYGGSEGGGTVFQITPEGTLSTLYAFCSQGSIATGCLDGANPGATLVQGSDGNLYGTTPESSGANYGTVFRITLSGALTTLHSFDLTDGIDPTGLVAAPDGNIYGTTGAGGAYGGGTIFKITPEDTLTTLYSFCVQSGCTDGSDPRGLVQGSDGNFYGATAAGGAYGAGVIFRFTPGGSPTTLYSFCSEYDGLCMDGDFPVGLLEGSDGNFYGATAFSSPGNWGGTVFKITPSGLLTTLDSFCPPEFIYCRDGNVPLAAPVQGTDGNFYGTTYQGGANDQCYWGCGTVFKLSVGLGAFVETRPTFGPEGKPVIILGNDLTDATSVSFNGAAARFSVVSRTEIKTSVPKGARTGEVRVTTPSGTLTSNVPFRVTACTAAPCILPMAQ